MAEQASGTVEGRDTAGTLAHAPGHLAHNPGKPMSWVAIVVIIIGFFVGGIAMMLGHIVWWLFWTGAAIAVVGCFMTLFTKTFSEDWY